MMVRGRMGMVRWGWGRGEIDHDYVKL